MWPENKARQEKTETGYPFLYSEPFQLLESLCIKSYSSSSQSSPARPAPSKRKRWRKSQPAISLLAEPKLDARAMHECQPLKGDTVAILEVRKNLDGMMGLNIAHVRVVDGLCTGKTGWIGVERLETAR